MKNIHRVIELLKREGIEAAIETNSYDGKEWHNIVWTDAKNNPYVIYGTNIAVYGEHIAWFRSDHHANHLLTVCENGVPFQWEPKTYNPVFGCNCLLVEWYKDHLIFIYQEKHDIYICSIKNRQVHYFNFHGEDIERNGDLISYETYMNKTPDQIKLVQIPELTQPEPIDRTEAERRGLIPSGLNRPDNFLGHDFGRSENG